MFSIIGRRTWKKKRAKQQGNYFQNLRMLLNDWFRASIKKKNFLITRPPFFIYTAQAVFQFRIFIELVFETLVGI